MSEPVRKGGIMVEEVYGTRVDENKQGIKKSPSLT